MYVVVLGFHGPSTHFRSYRERSIILADTVPGQQYTHSLEYKGKRLFFAFVFFIKHNMLNSVKQNQRQITLKISPWGRTSLAMIQHFGLFLLN